MPSMGSRSRRGASSRSTVRLLCASSTIVGGMTIAALCALALSLVIKKPAPTIKDPCQCEQTWSRGDQHYYEILELRTDMTGR